MRNYEKQIRAISEHFDEQMRSVEQLGVEVLSPIDAASNLHRIIHNPTQEGIDEG
jgi:hypothetical protein